MNGIVISTSGQVISGATVLILDGINAGRLASTNSVGRYEFGGLTPANANLSANAGGYFESRDGLFINGTNTLDFRLTPVPPPPPPEAPPSITISATHVASGPGYVEWAFTTTGTVEFSSYAWDFGDGGAVDNGRSVEQHLYTEVADVVVRVTARPRSGGSPVVGTLRLEVRF